ncbi:hypothetical protein [Actinomadura montaniterrae]|uniref:Integral membrane protein n=1 Tax=Actinomadura montaniterrae TaxID=1803903 RepID=A0A6L3VY18_9ACTN|nr:hypothetical protein [Actinomadura montaniterrae]KAB2382726.1 hypothetical protein F9B16_14110 [Actinomadura montaniterrae]
MTHTASPGGAAPDGRAASALRFLAEIIAWVAAPWALAPHSIVLAVLADVVLIGLPTVFSTPGDKARVMVPVPGVVTIGLVLLQLAAAVAASWAAWPMPVAVAVTVLCAAVVAFEQPRWRWLVRRAPEREPV